MFITFEGCEASGKSTQCSILFEKLLAKGYKVWLTKEPGGTVLANRIRQIILESEIEDGLTELLLISAARRDHIRKIKEKLEKGYVVISDRFIDSSVAYQGYGKHVSLTLVQTIIQFSTEGFKPDLTFLLIISNDAIQNRIAKSNKHTNFYDCKEAAFHAKIQEAFLKIAEQEKQRICLMDGNDKIDNIGDKIWYLTQKLLPEL